MRNKLLKMLAKAQDEVISGNSLLALEKIEAFVTAAENASLDDETKKVLKAKIAELHRLSVSSLEGARSATEKLREIIEAACHFQCYDETGTRQETSIVANIPRRF